VDAEKRLTPIGRQLAQLPIDAALGRMLVEAQRLGVTRELIVLASFLSVQDPRERPADARPQADAAHARFADPRSDFIGVLKLWAAYNEAHADLTQSKLRDWCQQHFLSFMRMREWRELHRQLLLGQELPGFEIRDSGFAKSGAPAAGALPNPESRIPNPGSTNPESPISNPGYEAIHRCLLSGWPTQVARKDERGQYRSTRERRFGIFPGSAVSKAPPQWLLAGQILDLQKVYALTCARVEPAWIEQQAAHLVKKSWRDAHWSRKRGAVIAFEQVTLFGLTLAEQRTVQFGRQDPAQAHAVFLREALARCEIDARADFVRANARVLAEAREIEAKRRRGGLLRSDEELAAFFTGKLPADTSTTAALDAWYRRATPTEQAAMHWSLVDVLADSAGVGVREFPGEFEIAGHALQLAYRFMPGDPADGVTLQLPLALVNAVPAARCEWLVPGLLAEKVAEAIRALPKTLRRNFVPAPDFARAFVEAEAVRDEPLLVALARYLQRVTGVVVTAEDFAGIELPLHLSMNFRVRDDNGEVLAEGRDLAAIQAQWTGAARVAFSRRADVELTREKVDAFDFDEIPASIVSSGGLTAFPALVDLGESVALRVFERHDEALAEHHKGVERLLRRTLADRLKQARRQLPLANALGLKWAAFGSAEALRADVVEAALVERFAAHELDIRERTVFQRTADAIARELFPAAVEVLALAEAIILAQAELRPLLEPPLIGFAKANYDDLREQLAELLSPGFLRETERSRLAQFPRYLKAMKLRAERLRQDPARDQARMLGVQLYWREYLKLRAGQGGEAALAELRWLVEELRVSTFAQELRTAEPVSPKRLAKLVESLRGSSP
jgi:ATP-dependent helicase HrpA